MLIPCIAVLEEIRDAEHACRLKNKKVSERVSKKIKKWADHMLFVHNVIKQYNDAKEILETFIETSEENELFSQTKVDASDAIRKTEICEMAWREFVVEKKILGESFFKNYERYCPKSDQKVFEELRIRQDLLEVIVKKVLPVLKIVVKISYSEERATYTSYEVMEALVEELPSFGETIIPFKYHLYAVMGRQRHLWRLTVHRSRNSACFC
ncbi:unnamed protein product [Caenorhabditis auriculariae]|uniref:Uncharacterized protein n=1 Tax=Caenorhabditis auriculariae TaxID=2777116 RepID=A0A8S1HWL2_9PELO|nr:unnamed protein product [Caenorhabditis auriculariae]